MTNTRSPQARLRRQQKAAHDEWPHNEPEQHREEDPAPPKPFVADEAEIDRETERNEDSELAQIGKRRIEVAYLIAAAIRDVSEDDAGDEDGEEARAVCDRGDAVDDPCRKQDGERVQGTVGKGDAPHCPGKREATDHARQQPDRHLDEELGRHGCEGGVAARRVLDHSDHESDPDGVVETGLPLEDGSRTALHFLAGEDRERDRGVGRCERRAEQP